MVKIAVYPPNSLILADLIERKGHTPLVLQKQIRQKIKKVANYNFFREDCANSPLFLPLF